MGSVEALDWITLSEVINWSHPRLGLSADFASVLGVNRRDRAPVAPEGVRDGLQFAEQLTGDPNVLQARACFWPVRLR